jgi:hypothetical protein
MMILLALTLFQIKHFLCDFIFQTERHVRFKGIYGHRAGIEHSAIHVAGTLPCLLILGVTFGFAIAIGAAEFVVHYHTDWAKEQIVRRGEWTPADHMFWNMLGLDQLIHQMTYIAIVGGLVIAGNGL